MPDWIVVLLLGVIEGITEFIPVSSTGHLLLTQRLLETSGGLAPDHWLVRPGAKKDLFNVVIQCGAVLAVLPLFPERLKQFFLRWREPATRDYLLKVAAAFGITGAGGLLLDRYGFVLPESALPVAAALVVGGLLFLLVEWALRGKALRDEITWTVAIAIGLGQLLAMIFPGTSRSGSTILLALMLGLRRPLAAEFSFLVGIPTMLSAGGLKTFRALQQTDSVLPEQWAMILLGAVIAAIVSFAAVKWLLRYVQTHTFIAFGWYRIILGAIILGIALL